MYVYTYTQITFEWGMQSHSPKLKRQKGYKVKNLSPPQPQPSNFFQRDSDGLYSCEDIFSGFKWMYIAFFFFSSHLNDILIFMLFCAFVSLLSCLGDISIVIQKCPLKRWSMIFNL
jgi:hypothetical protein